MLGKTTPFVPGFDHAGISTQSVVEKRLFKTSGRTRHDLGREKFVETVLEWKNELVFVFFNRVFLNSFLTGTKNVLPNSFINWVVATTGLVLPSQ